GGRGGVRAPSLPLSTAIRSCDRQSGFASTIGARRSRRSAVRLPEACGKTVHLVPPVKKPAQLVPPVGRTDSVVAPPSREPIVIRLCAAPRGAQNMNEEPSPPSDRECLVAWRRSRTVQSLEPLVQRYAAFVHASAHRRTGGDEAQAAEITRAVFLVLARRAAKLSRKTVLAGWLFTITNLAVRKT